MTNYLDMNIQLYKGKRVLELGAASSLPSIVACLNGASFTCSTDYPDISVLENIKENALINVPDAYRNGDFQVKGYIWGQKQHTLDDPIAKNESEKYDLILMADLIFNHNQHHQLLQSCRDLLKDDGKCLVTFTHHNPKWVDRDLRFFELCLEYGFEYVCLFKEKWCPMFVDDVGDEETRSLVFGYQLSKSTTQSTDLAKREE